MASTNPNHHKPTTNLNPWPQPTSTNNTTNHGTTETHQATQQPTITEKNHWDPLSKPPLAINTTLYVIDNTMKNYARKWPHKHQLHHLHHHRSLQPLTTNTTIYVIDNNNQALVPYLLRLARGPHQTLCTSPSSHIRLDRFICRKVNGNMTYPGQWRNKPNNATVSNQESIMTKRTQHEDFLCWSKWCGKHVLVIALSRMGLNHSNNFLFLFYNISSLFANSHNTHQLRKNLHVQS